jgi:AcrR family transcriptional regulator
LPCQHFFVTIGILFKLSDFIMTTDEKKARGRPRVFDMDEALDKALGVFWERGYEGASLAELVETLGINKPSLYAAFGNKEGLFQKALTRYVSGPVAFVGEVIKEPTARKVAERFLIKAAEFFTDPSHPKGCMIVQGALSSGESAELVRDILIKYRSSYENLLAERFEKAKADGDLSIDANPKELAKYLATLHQGMSVQATSGATKDELVKVANLALKVWSN